MFIRWFWLLIQYAYGCTDKDVRSNLKIIFKSSIDIHFVGLQIFESCQVFCVQRMMWEKGHTEIEI